MREQQLEIRAYELLVEEAERRLKGCVSKNTAWNPDVAAIRRHIVGLQQALAEYDECRAALKARRAIAEGQPMAPAQTTAAA